MKTPRTLGLVALALAGCTSVFPRAAELRAAGLVETPSAEARLEAGRSTMIVGCQPCHRLYSPDEFPAERWRPIVARMGPRAGLDEDETAAVADYLDAAARLQARQPAGAE